MSKNFSQEAFEAESKKVWGDRVEHSKTVFTSLRDKVTFTLDGMEFTQTAWRHINGVRPQGLFAASRTTSLESLKARSQAIDGDKYNLSLVTEVKNVGQIIPVICNYCGETFLQSVRHRIEGRQCKCQKGKAPRKIAAKKKYSSHYLYFLRCFRSEKDTVYKVGIVSDMHNGRFAGIKTAGGFDKIEILCLLKGRTEEIRDLEKCILCEFWRLSYKRFEEKFEGSTEFFAEDVSKREEFATLSEKFHSHKHRYLDIDTIYVSGKRMTKFEEANDPPPKFHDFMKKYINNPKREREYGPNSACTNQND